MAAANIPVGYYTHLNFAFATIDPTTFEVQATDDTSEAMMTDIQTIRKLQPDVEIWISLGGWSFNDPGATQTTFSDLASTEENQDAFIKSLNSFMATYEFDGVDLDWEYPVDTDRGGSEDDFDNFTALLKKVKQKVKGAGSSKGLSITLPSSYWYMQHFDIVKMEPYVDWFNIMSYDLHGTWDMPDKNVGPYLNAHTNITELQTSLDLLWRNNIDPDKVVLGMAFYGRSFTVVDPSCTEPGCEYISAGNAGNCSNTAGILLNPEIKNIISDNKLKPTLHKDAGVKALSWESQWVAYDDEDTWKLKAEWASKQCISGVMVWALSQDDDSASNAKALVSAVNREVIEPVTIEPAKKTTVTTYTNSVNNICRWTACGENCPSGFKEVPRDGTELMMTDTTGCVKTSDGKPQTKFCCPADKKQPTCTWRGYHSSGVCSAGCHDGEVKVGTLSEGCNIGHQVACCTNEDVTKPYSRCEWVGTSPLCAEKGKDAECDNNYSDKLVTSSNGFGGDKTCGPGRKSYCCTSIPDEFTQCAWYSHGKAIADGVPDDYYCEADCPDGTVRLAMHKGSCKKGFQAFCCKGKARKKTLTARSTYGNLEYETFVRLLEDYMKAPYCPATQESGMDYYYGVLTKRDSSSSTCSPTNWTQLMQLLFILFRSDLTPSPQMISAYNEGFADNYDYQLTYGNLTTTVIDTLQSGFEDFRAWITDMMLSPIDAGPMIREITQAEDDYCYEDGEEEGEDDGYLDTRDLEVLEERRLNPVEGTSNVAAQQGAPSVITILRAINDGTIPLNYARWIHYGAATGAHPEGPTLELAYYLGTEEEMGQSNPPETVDSNFDQFRDPAQGTVPDRFVVFHVHFDANHPTLTTGGGRTLPATSHVNIFHGRYTVQDGRNLRVYNRETRTRGGGPGRNARSPVFVCHRRSRDRTSTWYPIGAQVRLAVLNRQYGRNRYSDVFQTWMRTLQLAGYFTPVVWRIPYPSLETIDDHTVDWTQLGAYRGGTDNRAMGTSFAMENGQLNENMHVHQFDPPSGGHTELK
ncbi:glycoside hydrolase family 18 protein [Aspergillus mulundensis]|uniref:chitinase n=1 Tax=Aspergillus mulundensis TaxID=1810919 RepID=A0A3D8RE55_9EURO|nr:hypothetical protein DSM5745_07519 [Aspergillus mulundensis]RDW72347.1 hypothetical protein DSM5745_07519 [Aspergillus mulundensis]